NCRVRYAFIRARRETSRQATPTVRAGCGRLRPLPLAPPPLRGSSLALPDAFLPPAPRPPRPRRLRPPRRTRPPRRRGGARGPVRRRRLHRDRGLDAPLLRPLHVPPAPRRRPPHRRPQPRPRRLPPGAHRGVPAGGAPGSAHGITDLEPLDSATAPRRPFAHPDLFRPDAASRVAHSAPAGRWVGDESARLGAPRDDFREGGWAPETANFARFTVGADSL